MARWNKGEGAGLGWDGLIKRVAYNLSTIGSRLALDSFCLDDTLVGWLQEISPRRAHSQVQERIVSDGVLEREGKQRHQEKKKNRSAQQQQIGDRIGL